MIASVRGIRHSWRSSCRSRCSLWPAFVQVIAMQSVLGPRLALLPLMVAMIHGQQQQQQQQDNNFPNLDKIVLPPATQSRVVGGDVITSEALGGFIVALRYKKEFICGGSLVEKRVVVSAAHCFIYRNHKHEWTAQGGITRLTDKGVEVPLLDYVVPASFKESTMHMDVAVIYLVKSIEGMNVNRIGLCAKPLTEGTLLTVAGWGLTNVDDKLPQQTLRAVSVPITRKSECKRVYQDAMIVTESMFCAGNQGEKDACVFDSGGPFFYENANGQKELCGIVSFGIGCASKKYPGVYTDVNYVKPFIVSVIDKYRKTGID